MKKKTKPKEFEKVVEWDFTGFNKIADDLFKVDSIWNVIFYPLLLLSFLIFYILFYPFYVLYHLFCNREVYFRDRW